MQNSDKLRLKWNDFQENLNSAFGLLRNDKDFSDVTLACEDGTQIETHKVVLASSSPFLMEVLKRSKHPHPLIYMRGIKSEDLVAMVDFLYYGEANVNQENLDAFLALAEELKLKGLTGAAENGEQERVSNKHPEKIIAVKKDDPKPIPNLPNLVETYRTGPASEREHSPGALVSVQGEHLDQQIKSMMGMSENMLAYKHERVRMRICKVCGKEGHITNIKTHIEANHIVSDVFHSCDLCGKISRSRHGLRLHKASQHAK